MSFIEVQNLSRRFNTRGPWALKDVNVTFECGEAVAIVGESGSGKTTLARLILGLDVPTSGSVVFNGKPIAGRGPVWRRDRKRLQMIPQHASGALNPRVSVRRHFEEVIDAHKLEGRPDHESLMHERLSEVGLATHFLNSYPRQLSGGQQQRVVIARSMLLSPDVLICDEPTSALDPLTSEQVIALLSVRCIQPSRFFAIITHDLRVARKVARRVIVMRKGEIVEDAPIQLVFSNPSHPYTNELVKASSFHPNRQLNQRLHPDDGVTSALIM